MNQVVETKNEYGFASPNKAESSGLATAQESKAVQEIQAALVIAQKYPRDPARSFESIMSACERPFLAEQAIYAYPKGKGLVTGPSIRLAEVLAQNWGNLSVGIREISQKNGVSEVEAFAWDLQTNFQETKIFHVAHRRDTKKGSYKITDQREIYELVANQGARRLRACILAVIPGDIVDAAVSKCEKTLASGNKEPLSDRIRKLISAFGELSIKVEHLEKRLGHKMDVTSEHELVTLRGIYKSIKDGMAGREDFFDIGGLSEKTEDVIAKVTQSKAPPTEEVVDKTTGEIKK